MYLEWKTARPEDMGKDPLGRLEMELLLLWDSRMTERTGGVQSGKGSRETLELFQCLKGLQEGDWTILSAEHSLHM